MTEFQPETYEIFTQWREILDEFTELTEDYRFMAVEAYGVNETMPFYEYNGKKGADMPINHALTGLKENCNGACVANIVHGWINNVPADKWSSWVVSSHRNQVKQSSLLPIRTYYWSWCLEKKH